jgi:hypothetical protein
MELARTGDHGGGSRASVRPAWALHRHTGGCRHGSNRHDERDDGTSSDDRRLVEDVLAGDREAFRRLVDREGSAVVAACARVLGDRTEAEDVARRRS